MKLDIRQLSERESYTIALALENYCAVIKRIAPKYYYHYTELASALRQSITLICTEKEETPIDDVQTIGANEKGGNAWS